MAEPNSRLAAPPPTPPPAKGYQQIMKAAALLPVNETELRLIIFLASLQTKGAWYSWTSHREKAISVSLALELNLPQQSVKRAIAALEKRGWVQRKRNFQGESWVQLTAEIMPACDDALERQRVRRQLSSKFWRIIGRNDYDPEAVVTEILKLAHESFEQGRWSAHLQRVLDAWIKRERESPDT